jgi:hypothetical protein
MRLGNGHKIIILIFFIFSVIKVSSLFVHHDIWWDSSVYIGMGKYIYSFGKVGLWEPSRPLVWPLILGIFWKLGLDFIFFGKLLAALFSIGVLLLTYMIAHRIFNKEVAILSTLFLAMSQTFFLFSNIIHAEIPSTFFALLGFYFFIEKRYAFSGIFFGIAFMTRFFIIFAVIPIFIALIYLVMMGKIKTKTLTDFSAFFLIPAIPYLILNHTIYKNPFHPFLLQYFMTINTGWVFLQPYYFYLMELIKENPMVLFSIFPLIFIFRKPELIKTTFILVFLFSFIPYNFVAHKEMRIIIHALPFLYILAAYGVFYFLSLIRKKRGFVLSAVFVIFLLFAVPKLKFDMYEDNLDPFREYLKNMYIEEGLWVSNPAFITNFDLKAEELIYFPLYNSEKIDRLISMVDEAKHVLINSCDLLPCPKRDTYCQKKNDEFISLLEIKFSHKLFLEYDQCKYHIFGPK